MQNIEQSKKLYFSSQQERNIWGTVPNQSKGNRKNRKYNNFDSKSLKV